jgi:hypothetical protein
MVVLFRHDADLKLIIDLSSLVSMPARALAFAFVEFFKRLQDRRKKGENEIG